MFFENIIIPINFFPVDNKANVRSARGKEVIESAIDHVYMTESLKDRARVSIVKCGLSDHDIIVSEIKKTTCHVKGTGAAATFTKRCFRNFNAERFRKDLANLPWEHLGRTEDVDEMVSIFTELVTEALDKEAPVKTFKIPKNYVHGLSEETKDTMKKRDDTWHRLTSTSKELKQVVWKQYKQLRNKCVRLTRRDTRKNAQEVIEKNGNNAKGLWNVVENLSKNRGKQSCRLDENGVTIENEKNVADILI